MTEARHTRDMSPPGLDFAFRVLLQFDAGPRLRFEPAFQSGRRGYVAVQGGSIEGPGLSGRVVPLSGGDWPRLWHSGLMSSSPLSWRRPMHASYPQ